MGLLETAKRDIQNITSNTAEWACPLTFISPAGQTVTVNGIHTKHHLGIDQDGNVVNTKKATCSVSEQTLINAGYTVRNAKGEVDLNGHKVYAPDSTGTVCKYIMLSFFPNETIGLITCILGGFKE